MLYIVIYEVSTCMAIHWVASSHRILISFVNLSNIVVIPLLIGSRLRYVQPAGREVFCTGCGIPNVVPTVVWDGEIRRSVHDLCGSCRHLFMSRGFVPTQHRKTKWSAIGGIAGRHHEGLFQW
jgi:hypothetical protein